MPQYMITTRKARDGDDVGPARYLMFDHAGGPAKDFGTNPKRWLAELMKQFPKAPRSLDGKEVAVGEILFLVHGFNVDHEEAEAFHVACADRLAAAGWAGQVVSFDWPSKGLVFAYLPDRENARAAASSLVSSGIRVLQQAQTADCAINVHVMCHSMGAFVTQQAFTWAYQDVPVDWRVGQLLFVAADVDRSVFEADHFTAKMFAQHAGRLTAYRNSYDKALMVANAKRLALAPRMGRVGLPTDTPAMMCEVDCSAYFDQSHPELEELDPAKTHGFYFASKLFWEDAALTLAGGIDRGVFPTRDPTGTPNRFILKPKAPSEAALKLAQARADSTPR